MFEKYYYLNKIDTHSYISVLFINALQEFVYWK